MNSSDPTPHTARSELTEADLVAMMDRLSNHGRWGLDDERGTLNFITDEVRHTAAQLVRTGECLSLAHALVPKASPSNPVPPVHRMLEAGKARSFCCIDLLEVAPHGWAITHLDAIGHISFEDRMWNGRRASEHVTATGLTFGSICAAQTGIFTRAVLLDIPAPRSQPYLAVGDHVGVADLEAAESHAGTRVRRGDAVIIRTGRDVRQAQLGQDPEGVVPGITAECLPWFYEREIALYSGDVADDEPSPVPRMLKPLHQIGIVAMGLNILDNVAVEELARRCDQLRRYDFLVTLAPLAAPAATGSAVNPLVIF